MTSMSHTGLLLCRWTNGDSAGTFLKFLLLFRHFFDSFAVFLLHFAALRPEKGIITTWLTFFKGNIVMTVIFNGV